MNHFPLPLLDDDKIAYAWGAAHDLSAPVIPAPSADYAPVGPAWISETAATNCRPLWAQTYRLTAAARERVAEVMG